ncbi:MAG: hypothetical protein ACI3Y0_04170 [Prevotella sp.]
MEIAVILQEIAVGKKYDVFIEQQFPAMIQQLLRHCEADELANNYFWKFMDNLR